MDAVLRLTVDAGNSSVKLVLWEADVPRERARLAWSEDLAAQLAAFLEPHPRVPAAGLSSVAGEARTGLLSELLEHHVGEVCVAPDSGMENRTREPWTVGRDRLYAARAAVTLVGGPVLVVDAGTALTVDAAEAPSAVSPRGADATPGASGVFLGGAIAPGPALLARALDRAGGGTADLPAVDPVPSVPALGRTTPEAMRSGIAVGFRGAAIELAERIALEAGPAFAAAPVVVCGGALAFLDEAFSRPTRIEPDLVARGLLLALDAPRAR